LATNEQFENTSPLTQIDVLTVSNEVGSWHSFTSYLRMKLSKADEGLPQPQYRNTALKQSRHGLKDNELAKGKLPLVAATTPPVSDRHDNVMPAKVVHHREGKTGKSSGLLRRKKLGHS